MWSDDEEIDIIDEDLVGSTDEFLLSFQKRNILIFCHKLQMLGMISSPTKQLKLLYIQFNLSSSLQITVLLVSPPCTFLV